MAIDSHPSTQTSLIDHSMECDSVLLSLVWGVPLAVAVAAIWYGPVIARHGWSFVDEFFIQHHFARYVSNKYHHPQPIYFYPVIILMLALPWTPYLVLALAKARSWEWRGADSLSIVRVFSVAWLLFPIVFFSFSGSKLPGYVLPAIPAAALLVSDRLTRVRDSKWPLIVAGSTVILVVIGHLMWRRGTAVTIKGQWRTLPARFPAPRIPPGKLHRPSHGAADRPRHADRPLEAGERPRHEADRDPVHHDRGHDLVRSGLDLEERREPRPDHRAEHRARLSPTAAHTTSSVCVQSPAVLRDVMPSAGAHRSDAASRSASARSASLRLDRALVSAAMRFLFPSVASYARPLATSPSIAGCTDE